MSQLSEKELSVLNDLLTEEDLLIKNSRCLQNTQRIRKSVQNLRRFPRNIRDILTPCMHS